MSKKPPIIRPEEKYASMMEDIRENARWRLKRVGCVSLFRGKNWRTAEDAFDSFPSRLEIIDHLNSAHATYILGQFVPAMLMAGRTLELAFKYRYLEFEKKKGLAKTADQKKLVNLIGWAKDEGFLDEKHAALAHKLRQMIRNVCAHPTPYDVDERNKWDGLFLKPKKTLTPQERKGLGQYDLIWQPNEYRLQRILRQTDEIINKLYPEIKRVKLMQS